jgi:hypothetical protein
MLQTPEVASTLTAVNAAVVGAGQTSSLKGRVGVAIIRKPSPPNCFPNGRTVMEHCQWTIGIQRGIAGAAGTAMEHDTTCYQGLLPRWRLPRVKYSVPWYANKANR